MARRKKPELTDDRRRAIVWLLEDAHFELIPLKNAIDQSAFLPEGASVSVTASPAKGMAATVDLSLELQQRGFDVIPHISARLTQDRAELADVMKRLGEAGLTRVFIVGGDADPPGDFFDAPTLIKTMEEMGHPFTEMGITGYPEGHPLISEERLEAALVEKAPHADYTATQMCFNPDTITSWIGSVRALGVDLPVVIGIPGVYDLRKLAVVSARIGVGVSARYLRKNSTLVGRLVRPGGYAPDTLILSLAATLADPIAKVKGFHIYTFNQVEKTEEWRQEFLESLAG